MSSPITFSGFNGIDFNTVLNAVIQQASQPLTVLQSQQAALRSQVTTIGSLSTRVSTLASAIDTLANLDGLNGNAATSSAPGSLGVSIGSDATPGQFEVVVNQLARAQVTASTSSSPDSDTTIVASGGSLTLGGVSVDIAGDTTLDGLAAAINGTADIGVSAAVIQASPGSYRLVLTGTQTGTASAFSITNSLTGGTGVTFGANAVEAADASLLVNNIAVTGSSNTFTDVLPDVTFTAYKADPGTTITVGITPSSTSLESDLDAFVTAYNDLAKFIDAQRQSAGRNEPTSIGREPIVRQLRSNLRTELLAAHGSEVFTRLSEVGVEFTTTGTLEINKSRLSEAVAENGTAVRNLFAGPDGVFTRLATQLADYTDGTDGFLSATTKRLNDRISTMDTQIANLQARIALQRDALLREFVAADSIISRLKNQSGSLSNFGSSIGSL